MAFLEMKNLALLGIGLILIGFLLVLISSIYSAFRGSTDIKSAGIFFIGPFPIGWASDKRMFYILIGLVILAMIIWWILNH